MDIASPRSPIEPQQLLSHNDAAKYLGIASGTLKGWRRRGCPQVDFINYGGLIKYSKAALDRFLKEHTQTSTQPSNGDV
ncbi:MAG: DNA-binding protein [Betaproteobacteria bacterium]|nr:DNA-binding protein [Betaproteobacteria bacterium]